MDLCLCSGTGVVARILFCGQFLAAGRDAQAAAASTAQLARELTAYTEEDFRRLIQRNERVKTAYDYICRNNGICCGHRIAVDAGNLHKTGDRVADCVQDVLNRAGSRLTALFRRAAHQINQTACSHAGSRAGGNVG